jgi:oxygen-independent coproporphyrinogen III oxidase
LTHLADIRFDERLMARYGQAGPRYTSYPTALQFTDAITPQEYLAAVAASDDALLRGPLSLYVHLPFCFSPCFYCGCNRIVSRDGNRIERYVGNLMQEIARQSRHFDRARVVEQLHFGGGTPTYLPKVLLMEIMESLAQHFQLTDAERDYSIEIDPRSIEPDGLQLLKELGFNRVSLGVQDFDPEVQRAVNRVQPQVKVQEIYQAARDSGFSSINFDLIYGLPLQTLETFGCTLDRVIAMRPDRLAVYGYAHMPGLFKAQRRIRTEDLPDTPTRLALLRLAIERLSAAGYIYIGLDHFALPSDSLARAKAQRTLHRSFQGYTTHANRDLVSFGVSAIGRVGDLFVQNHKQLSDYEGAIERGLLPLARGVRLDRDDRIRGDVIQQIMCHGFLDIGALEAHHAIRFEEYFSNEITQLQTHQDEGLLEMTDKEVRLTAPGRLLMRAVAMSFDAYLRP